MLTQKEFDVLLLLYQARTRITQRKIAEDLNYSVGTVNKLLKSFQEKGYYNGKAITQKGLDVLEPYRVKRAIFIAAGLDTKLAPITLNTPKPLIRVNGVRMIDTLLDAVVAAEIPEIIIVRGYLGDQFDQLLYKYPQIKFVENPMFNEHNNICSAMCVRFLFQNAYVMDADLILTNPNLIRKYEYRSHILGFPVDRTDDWCVTLDKNGYVNTAALGGVNGYRYTGIFYWNAEDGGKLAEDINTVFLSPGGKERYWEQTPLVYKKEHYQLTVRECGPQDVLEIRTFKELQQADPMYNL